VAFGNNDDGILLGGQKNLPYKGQEKTVITGR
jgi:hypothetical protein